MLLASAMLDNAEQFHLKEHSVGEKWSIIPAIPRVDQQLWHHLGAYFSGVTSGLTPNLLSQNLHFNIMPRQFVGIWSLRSTGLSQYFLEQLNHNNLQHTQSLSPGPCYRLTKADFSGQVRGNLCLTNTPDDSCFSGIGHWYFLKLPGFWYSLSPKVRELK
jgi:hypothetical protein